MQSDEEIENSIKDTLDKSIDELEPEIERRLRQARLQAVEAAGRKNFVSWKPLSAFAFSVVLVMAVVIWPNSGQDESVTPMMTDIELFATDDSLQLYEELEFYEWLLENDSLAG